MARASRYGQQRVAVLREIDERVRRHSRVPTVRELAELFEVSSSTMHSWLSKLNEEGLVEWTSGRHRSLHTTQRATQLLSSLGGP